MQITDLPLQDLKLIEPRVFPDERGWFAESYNETAFARAGLPTRFLQDNLSHSRQGVIRGLHYQLQHPQGKLVRVLSGTIYDVVVDLRRSSPTFGKWTGVSLSRDPLQMLWVPPNFAHGFIVLSQTADVMYKTTAPWFRDGERTLLWDDPTLAIDWPLCALPAGVTPIVSAKDLIGSSWADAELPDA